MVDHDVLDMEEAESDRWYATLIDTEKEIQSIVNLDMCLTEHVWEPTFDSMVNFPMFLRQNTIPVRSENTLRRLQ